MKNDWGHYKVIKKLAPGRPGAMKLAERYGQKLVCVRHRVDPNGTTRFTTVELIVEQAPVRPWSGAMVSVRIGFQDRPARAAALAAGATWDRDTKLWRMKLRTARKLNLQECIVEES